MTQWTTPGFGQVAELVRERTGLVFPDARVSDVEATIRRTMARRGIDELPALTRLLRDDETAREAFVAELTIGESYFNRDPSQLEVLRDRILSDLIVRRAPDRPIRVWSAGCASGEEAYTVAMLFDQLRALNRCDIVGTDIARSRLEQAQRGLYSAWSLRNTGPVERARYFTERGRFHALRPRIRERVDFKYLNLAADAYPSLSTGMWGMDIILCRNVLIYFDAPTVRLVAERLLATLSEDGWLVLGASDPSIGELVDCDVVLTDAGLVYRRLGAAGDSDVRRGWPRPTRQDSETSSQWTDATDYEIDGQERPDVRAATEAADAMAATDAETAATDRADAAAAAAADAAAKADAAAAKVADADAANAASLADAQDADMPIVAAYAARDFDRVTALASKTAEQGRLGLRGWTSWLRALANQGCLEEASQVAGRALDAHGSAAELLYLHAVLLMQAGMVAEAGAAARRALYLNRKLVVAHLTLAESERRSGSVAAARRALNNAATLLSAMPPEVEVPASDGETAGRLAELVRVKIRLLENES